MKSRPIEFRNAEGVSLAGTLETPGHASPHAWCVFAHVFTGSKDLGAAVHISRALCAEGFGVLRFDFTGLGQSEGDFAATNFSSNVQDIVAAAAYLAEHHQAPALLVGHSLGGTATLKAAREIDSCRAVVSIGSPADPEHILHLLEDRLDDIESEGQARVTIAGRQFCIRKQFIEDVRAQDWQQWLRKLDRPLLILHSPADEVVDIHNAALIYKHAPHPKSFVSLDDADHLLSKPADARYAGQLIASWALRYLPWPAQEEKEPRADTIGTAAVSKAEGVVAHIGRDRFRTEVRAAGHTLVADEPESVGGENAGPSPYDLLSAALGTCTAMTLRMYADQKGWPLDEVEVRVRHEKIHARDCDDCETREGRIDQLQRSLVVRGELDETQRKRLLEIADRCPVHRTLNGEVKIRTTLLE